MKRSNKAKSTASAASSQPHPTSWVDVYGPRTADDLAVHKQKVDAVRNWLKLCRPNKANYLLITGPPGCGKTACVRVLADELGFELNEWLSPTDDEYSKENSGYQSQKEKFFEFLFKTSRYQSLFHQKRRLLMVEDFPNILLDQKQLFVDILAKYKEVGKSPVIFIASDTKSKSLDIGYRLFPSDVQAQFAIHDVTFNAISTTLMKKALQTLLANLKRSDGFADRFREPTASVLDSLIVSSQGDIRNAILNLQFVSQKNLPQVGLVPVEETSNKDIAVAGAKKTKRAKTNSNKLREIGRDETLSLLHGVGRVLNPKFDAEKRLTHCPEAITEAFITQPSNLLLFLFSNYLAHFSTIPDCANCSQHMSMSDYLLSEYRDQCLPEMALNLGIRGTMLANSAPVSGWHPVRGHKRDKVREDGVDAEYSKFIGNGGRNLVAKNTFVLDYKGSLDRILSKDKTGKLIAAVDDLDEEERNLILEIETVDSD